MQKWKRTQQYRAPIYLDEFSANVKERYYEMTWTARSGKKFYFAYCLASHVAFYYFCRRERDSFLTYMAVNKWLELSKLHHLDVRLRRFLSCTSFKFSCGLLHKCGHFKNLVFVYICKCLEKRRTLVLTYSDVNKCHLLRWRLILFIF